MQCPSCQTPVDASQRFCPACGTVLSAGGEGGADPLIGQVLGGKYKVVRLIGEGGMGAVYEGEQPLGTTRRRVAVKTLHPHLSRDPKIKARFEREVATIAELEHPNTIQVYDFGTTPEGILYLVMEFLHGKSLADLLEREGAMAPERVDAILQQVCGSLEEAHAHGIVHRDLKPDNVVLVERAGKKDFVKVLDFGIAKRSKEEDKDEQKLTQQGMVLGTPPYMSPEQFTGRPIDSRSDIYSLGVMAYEMLSGKLPFKADTAWEWATQHMTQPPIPIESLAEGQRATEPMRAALRRALAKSPDERFQTVREFIEAFSAPSMRPMMPSGAMGGPPRQRTEVATPLDANAAFGGAPAMGPGGGMAGMAGMPGAPVPGYTPVGGNVAFPTPAAIPQPPPRDAGGGGNRKPLLVAAGVIGIASVLAIAFAVKGGSSGSAKDVQFDTNESTPTPATTLAPAAGSADPALATATASVAGVDVPPLNGEGAVGPHPAATAHEPKPTTGPAPAPSPGPSPALPAHTNTPQSLPPMPTFTAPAATTPPPPAAKYDGPECQRARVLKMLGHPKEAQTWTLACIAKGGSVN
jgi:tRNA A-37 threonylcarbamoyl transferase component Bud32